MPPVITRMPICITHLRHKKISRKATLKRTLNITRTQVPWEFVDVVLEMNVVRGVRRVVFVTQSL